MIDFMLCICHHYPFSGLLKYYFVLRSEVKIHFHITSHLSKCHLLNTPYFILLFSVILCHLLNSYVYLDLFLASQTCNYYSFRINFINWNVWNHQYSNISWCKNGSFMWSNLISGRLSSIHFSFATPSLFFKQYFLLVILNCFSLTDLLFVRFLLLWV